MTDYFVHESAEVDDGAVLGKGTRVWHFSHVMAGAVIGQDCNLGQNVFVADDVNIGDNCKIQNNVSVYKGVTLEEGVFCGPSCVFTNVVNPRSLYPAGDDYVDTLVKHGASIGANATVICGVTIGSHAFIGAGSVVSKDVPDYAVAYGVPATVHGWMCECGEKLEFENNKTTCLSCRRSFELSPPRIVREVST